MKSSILTVEVSLGVREELDFRSPWENFFKKLEDLFCGSFESDWEKKTGLDWQEWGKYPHIE